MSLLKAKPSRRKPRRSRIGVMAHHLSLGSANSTKPSLKCVARVPRKLRDLLERHRRIHTFILTFANLGQRKVYKETGYHTYRLAHSGSSLGFLTHRLGQVLELRSPLFPIQGISGAPGVIVPFSHELRVHHAAARSRVFSARPP